MTYPLVQFVSAPEVDADVRFDFNAVGSWADAETWPGHEGFSIGVPSLEGDPDAVGVEYGFRELSFSLFIKGDKASALAAQSALAKEILRRTNWLRFQLTEHSEPVWFKTYRSAPGEIDFQYVYTETAVDHWGIAVTLTADPFAYGAREELPPFTIHNDPAVPPSPINPPTLNAATTATTGGTLAAATYYYVVTATTSAGQSTISNRVSIATTGTTSTVGLSWNAVTDAAGYKVYRATTSGQEKLLATLGKVTSYTDTGTATSTTAYSTANTTAGNPLSFRLPVEIKGDAPTPVTMSLLQLPLTPVRTKAYFASIFAAYSIPSDLIVWQSSDMELVDTGSSSELDDSKFSGGSYRRVVFNSADHLPRVQALWVTPARGRYKLLARVGRSDATSSITVSATIGSAAGPIATVAGQSDSLNWATLVDLGDFEWPLRGSEPSPYGGSDGGFSAFIILSVGRPSGSAQVAYIDYLVAVPLSAPDGDATTLSLDDYSATQEVLLLDGEQESSALAGVSSYNSPNRKNTVSNVVPPAAAGNFPRVVPGASHLVHVFPHVSNDAKTTASGSIVGNDDVITESTEVVMSYRPRYLYLGAS